jgi:hypothetical protein
MDEKDKFTEMQKSREENLQKKIDTLLQENSNLLLEFTKTKETCTKQALELKQYQSELLVMQSENRDLKSKNIELNQQNHG